MKFCYKLKRVRFEDLKTFPNPCHFKDPESSAAVGTWVTLGLKNREGLSMTSMKDFNLTIFIKIVLNFEGLFKEGTSIV